MYIIILTFYATAGWGTPTSSQKEIPNLTFETRTACDNFGNRVKLAEDTKVRFNCVLVENK
jgi:hypothetical protein